MVQYFRKSMITFMVTRMVTRGNVFYKSSRGIKAQIYYFCYQGQTNNLYLTSGSKFISEYSDSQYFLSLIGVTFV